MLYFLLIILGFIAIICGLNFKIVKVAKNNYTKSISDVLQNIEANRVINRVLDTITRNKDLWFNRFENRILELSEVGISLKRMYLIKTICCLLCVIVFVAVRYTNVGYEQKLVILDSGKEVYLFYNSQEQDEQHYRFFKMVLSKAGKNNLEKSNDAKLFRVVEEKVAEVLNSSEQQEINKKTEWFIDKWKDTHKIRFFKTKYLFLILISVFIPDVFLVIRWLVKGALYKKEIIKLEYIFELLARIDGIKTLDIINELQKSSKTYAVWLRQFSAIFRFDKKKGFEYLKSKNVKCLSKFTDIMEIYSLHDKEVALQILDREAMERDESIIMVADETLDFIDLIAFLSIVPLVYELARLMLNPMLDIVYKAFEFI